ncbi:hypothetical protein [Streptomyces malaysiensis]|uniref:Uncharacterized protein n=1 Tax=Streptomyces malaysiensis subsp. samsunensis TaxID=459658 RepID=A0A9X2LXX0_STRMQ|nr:hypothetical protein [Streptomyces samsunensis]MCQ8832006.1 hypothetical protein [Streptomyces samsunensis]
MPQMSQFMAALIASGTILTIVLATDLGRRRVTTMRMMRSIIAVGVVIAIFVDSFPTKGGNDLSLQLVGIGVGVIAGLIAGALLPAYKDATSGQPYTIGGIGYALVWIVLSSGRVIFAYGAEHWFPADLIKFSIDYEISGQDTYANAFIFMALAMVLTRTGVLLAKIRKLKSHGAGNEQLTQQAADGVSAGA